MHASSPEWYLAPHLSEGDRRVFIFASCAGCGHLFVTAPRNHPTPRWYYPHPRETQLARDSHLTDSDTCPFCHRPMSECRPSASAEILAAGYTRTDYE
jgi:hypothetical protein